MVESVAMVSSVGVSFAMVSSVGMSVAMVSGVGVSVAMLSGGGVSDPLQESGVLKKRKAQFHPLFRVHWNRVILDEAHTIRNPDTAMSQGASALTAGEAVQDIPCGCGCGCAGVGCCAVCCTL